MSNQELDTKPWYKQFWPWLLISIPAATAVAGFATIWLASSEPVALVRDDYYKEGLAVNRNLAKERAAVLRDLSSHLEFDTAKRQITADLRGDYSGAELTLAFIHPLEINRDQSVILQKIGDGRYQGELPVQPDRWYLQLEGNDQDERWRMSGAVDLREEAATLLQAKEG